jgi:hypothetical protein
VPASKARPSLLLHLALIVAACLAGNARASDKGGPSSDDKPKPEAPPRSETSGAPSKAEDDKAEAGDKPEAEDGSSEKKSPKDDDVQRVVSNKHLEVNARSLRLTKTARTRLLAVAARYRESTGKKLVITGGDRDPRTQAKLMYKKAEAGEDLLALYTRTDLVRPILDAYRTARSAKRHSERSVIEAMTKVIKAQVDRDDYVSRHLEFGAADVRSRGLTEKDVAALRAAVRAEPGVKLTDERDTSSPHLHLGL